MLGQQWPCIEGLFHCLFYLIGKYLSIHPEMAGRPFERLQIDKIWIFRSTEFERHVVVAIEEGWHDVVGGCLDDKIESIQSRTAKEPWQTCILSGPLNLQLSTRLTISAASSSLEMITPLRMTLSGDRYRMRQARDCCAMPQKK
ncbi:hypothetical protein AB4Z52_09275 [Rhizobium sp. 2YAF20]|uniref:hypothetical protein n=1 Tax=Rhizobium sp. 2YAF20 TaxID=3233027 RepID=UPI003F9C7B9E